MHRRFSGMTLLALVSWAAMIFLYAPLSAAVLYAFSARPLLTWPFEGWSLQWFGKLFVEAAFRRAFLTSFGIALVSAFVATAIGTAAAIVFTRSGSVLSRFVQVTTRVPVMLPGLFIGISLVAFMIATGAYPGLTMIVVAHVIVSIPWVILVLTARLRTYDLELEAAARDLGCSPLRVLTRVTLPLISPALIAAFLLTFAGSFDETPVTMLVSGQETTVPLYIASRLRRVVDPTGNAVAVILLLIPWVSLAVAAVIMRRSGGIGAVVGRADG